MIPDLSVLLQLIVKMPILHVRRRFRQVYVQAVPIIQSVLTEELNSRIV